MNLNRLVVGLLFFVFLSVGIAEERTGNMTIIVKGFRNNLGKARILIFSDKEKKYFPSEHSKAYGRYIVPIKEKKVIFTFQKLPFGEYSISVHHDEDGNNKINKNWYGLPNEGLGASNDAKGNFGPPSFDKARVKLDKDELVIEINMVYG